MNCNYIKAHIMFVSTYQFDLKRKNKEIKTKLVCRSIDGRYCHRAGVANLRLASHMRLFEGLFVALNKCTRVPFSFLCYYILKNYYRPVCVLKFLLNY